MPPIGSSDQFIHQITQQFVFQRLWTGNATTPELAPASTPTIDWYAVIIPIYSMQLAISFDAAQLVPIIKLQAI